MAFTSTDGAGMVVKVIRRKIEPLDTISLLFREWNTLQIENVSSINYPIIASHTGGLREVSEIRPWIAYFVRSTRVLVMELE